MLWERINWLNPTIPFNATTIPKGTTVCVKNGAPPADVPLYAEPGGPADVCGPNLCCRSSWCVCASQQQPKQHHVRRLAAAASAVKSMCCVADPVLRGRPLTSASQPALQTFPTGCRRGPTSLSATRVCMPTAQPTSPAAVSGSRLSSSACTGCRCSWAAAVLQLLG